MMNYASHAQCVQNSQHLSDKLCNSRDVCLLICSHAHIKFLSIMTKDTKMSILLVDSFSNYMKKNLSLVLNLYYRSFKFILISVTETVKSTQCGV